MKAYIFPGQGSQFPGMAKEIYESCPHARRLLDEADHILGYSITDMMFHGTADDLRQTVVTQPAVFLHSVVMALSSPDFRPDMVAGHSLGEYSAIVAAGALSFEEGLELVSVRANAMQKASETVKGSMAAIIGLCSDTVEEICSSTEGIVTTANYNCDNQVVISGEKSAVERVCAKTKAAGARHVIMLSVGGAFHSPLMTQAAGQLAAGIEAAAFKKPSCPVYQNVNALPSTDPEVIKTNLLTQLTSPVRWTQTIRNMISDGADTFIECGPGKVLQGFLRHMNGSAQDMDICDGIRQSGCQDD